MVLKKVAHKRYAWNSVFVYKLLFIFCNKNVACLMLHQASSSEVMCLLQKVGHIVIKCVKFEHNKHF